MEIVLATGNQHKLREFREILETSAVSIVPLTEFPNCPEVVEDGDTFEANALKKARVIAAHTGRITMADDSGLEVDALGGAPGIYSSRYAGEQADDITNIVRLLKNMQDIPAGQRGAQFRCVIAVVTPDGAAQTVQGICRGEILNAPRGSDGFGYDPVFLDLQSGKTFAQLTSDEKNSISHRGRAIRELKMVLPEFLSKMSKIS